MLYTHILNCLDLLVNSANVPHDCKLMISCCHWDVAVDLHTDPSTRGQSVSCGDAFNAAVSHLSPLLNSLTVQSFRPTKLQTWNPEEQQWSLDPDSQTGRETGSESVQSVRLHVESRTDRRRRRRKTKVWGRWVLKQGVCDVTVRVWVSLVSVDCRGNTC